MIEASNLTKFYGDICAVDHVDFHVEKGEIFGFLGPNGAGKTTTIRMLVGLTRPSEGTASVAGYDVVDEIVEVKRRIGVVPENSNLYDELSVWDNLLFCSRLYHVAKNEREDRVRNLIEIFNLEEKRRTKFGKLSKGLKRRAIIAAALIHRPVIVFMDEPTSGLDVVSAVSLRNLIRELRKEGVTIFLTTHYIEEADQLSDRVAIIVKGKIVTIDTPEKIKASIKGTPVLEARLSKMPSESIASALETVGRVEMIGDRIRIATDDLTWALRSLVRVTSQQGIHILDVNTLHPSLEEAFVELTGVSPELMRMEKEGRR